MQSFHVDAHGFQLFPSISPVAFGLFKPPAQGRLFGGSGESPLTAIETECSVALPSSSYCNPCCSSNDPRRTRQVLLARSDWALARLTLVSAHWAVQRP